MNVRRWVLIIIPIAVIAYFLSRYSSIAPLYFRPQAESVLTQFIDLVSSRRFISAYSLLTPDQQNISTTAGLEKWAKDNCLPAAHYAITDFSSDDSGHLLFSGTLTLPDNAVCSFSASLLPIDGAWRIEHFVAYLKQ
jgi:hypothetical protein